MNYLTLNVKLIILDTLLNFPDYVYLNRALLQNDPILLMVRLDEPIKTKFKILIILIIFLKLILSQLGLIEI